MLRKDVPWFDERFRGSDGGCVAQAADMARHLSFAVHRFAFAVRVPSPVPEQALSAAEAIYDQVRKLVRHHVSACVIRLPQCPIVNSPEKRCRGLLCRPVCS